MVNLIIDGNWMLMNRVFAKKKELESGNLGREQKKHILKEALSAGVSWYLRNPMIYSGLYIVSDHGSWRKELIEDGKNVYKANRKRDSSIDWDLVWETFNEFLSGCREKGIGCPNAPMIEGDDWVCGLVRKINESGDCCVILSSDQDLTQLVREGRAWTVWINDRGELRLHIRLLIDTDSVSGDGPKTTISFWEQNSLFEYRDVALETLKNSARKISYINPEEVVIKKVLAGDKSDNIIPVLEKEHNGRISHFTEKETSDLMNSLGLWKINELTERLDEIYEYIKRKKRWSDVKLKLDDLRSRINYNINLVLLDDKLIPEVYKKQFSIIINNTTDKTHNDMNSQTHIINSITEDRMFLAGDENLMFDF